MSDNNRSHDKWQDAGAIALASALFLGVLTIFVFPGALQFHKYSEAAAQLLAGTLPKERQLDFSPLYLYLHLLQARFFPGSSYFMQALHVAAGAVASAALYLVLRHRYSRLIAFAGTFVFLSNRALITYAAIWEPEILLVMFLCCFLWASDREGAEWAVGPGLFLSLCILTRPNLTPLLAVVPLDLRFRYGPARWQRPAFLTAVLPIMALLLLAGRNYSVTGSYSPVVMNPGFVFFEGNNPLSSGQSAVYPPLIAELRNELSDVPDNPHVTYRLLAERVAGAQLSTAGANSYWATLGLHYIADYPWQWFRLEAYKLYSLWHEFRRYDLFGAYAYSEKLKQTSIPTLPYGVLSVLAIFGMVYAPREKRSYLLPFSLFALQAFSMLIFYVSDRQRLALLPLLVIFACLGLQRYGEIHGRWRVLLLTLGTVGAIVLSLPVDRMKDDLYLWGSDDRYEQYSVQGVRLRNSGDLQMAARSAALAFASAPWFEDRSRPEYTHYTDSFAVQAAALWPELKRSGHSAEFDRGVLTLTAGNLDAAKEIFSTLAATGNRYDRGFLQSSLPHYYLGLIALKRGDKETAKKWWETSLTLAPGDPFTLAHLAALTGEERYRSRLRRYFGDIESDWLEGRALFEEGRASKAVPLLTSLVQSVPEFPRAAIYLAAAVGATGDSLTGRSIYLQATTDRPEPLMLENDVLRLFSESAKRVDDPASHYLYGVQLGKFGHYPEGIATLNRAIARNPTSESAQALDKLRGIAGSMGR